MLRFLWAEPKISKCCITAWVHGPVEETQAETQGEKSSKCDKFPSRSMAVSIRSKETIRIWGLRKPMRKLTYVFQGMQDSVAKGWKKESHAYLWGFQKGQEIKDS